MRYPVLFTARTPKHDRFITEQLVNEAFVQDAVFVHTMFMNDALENEAVPKHDTFMNELFLNDTFSEFVKSVILV